MPATPCAMRFSPQNQDVTVDITTPGGARPDVYTTQNGSTTHILPLAVTDTTEFWFTGPGDFVLSAKIDGVEVASKSGTTQKFAVNGSGIVALEAGADLEELLLGLIGGGAGPSFVDTDSVTDGGVTLPNVVENTEIDAIKIANSYTQTADPTDAALGSPFFIDWDATLNYTGGASVGPITQTSNFGPRGAFNLEGTHVYNENTSTFGLAAIGYSSQLFVKNQASAAQTVTGSYDFLAARIYLADGATLTVRDGDWADGHVGFADSTTYFTGNTGTLNVAKVTGFLSQPGAFGDVNITDRIAYEVGDINTNNVGGPTVVDDGIASLLGVSNDNSTTTQATTNQYGVYVPRLTAATNNYGIRCDTPIVLEGDTATLTTASPPASITISGTHTYGTAGQVYGAALSCTRTHVVDAALSAFTVTALFNDASVYKSAANTTNRDLGLVITSYISSPTVAADQSDDTLDFLIGFASDATLLVTGAGSPTLAISNLKHFEASSPDVGASVTVTTRKGLEVNPWGGSGTVTDEIGADINVAEGQTLIRQSKSTTSAARWYSQQRDGTTSGAASVTFDFPTATDTAYMMKFYTVGHQTNGLEEVGIYEDLCRVKNDGGTVTVTLITQRLSEEVSTWSVTPSASTTNVRVTCTGVAGDDVSWVCHAEILAEGS